MRQIRKVFSLLLLAASPMILSSAASTEPAREPVGGVFAPVEAPFPVPDFVFRDATGVDRGFVEYRGKFVIAYFWATWCTVCAIDMPALDELQAKLTPGKAEIVALSIDKEGVDVVKAYLRDRGLTHLAAYHDSQTILAAVLGIRGTPTAFLIDPDGQIIGASEGAAAWSAPATLSALESLYR